MKVNSSPQSEKSKGIDTESTSPLSSGRATGTVAFLDSPVTSTTYWTFGKDLNVTRTSLDDGRAVTPSGAEGASTPRDKSYKQKKCAGPTTAVAGRSASLAPTTRENRFKKGGKKRRKEKDELHSSAIESCASCVPYRILRVRPTRSEEEALRR